MKRNVSIVKYTEAVIKLQFFKEEDDQSSFNLYIQDVFPEIKLYLERQLEVAIKRGSFAEGKYKAEDFIDDLYIKAYDHIQHLDHSENLKVWLFNEADNLLKEILVEEEFDNYFFENIEDYSQLEWNEMEEKFSIDGGRDFVMEEDLDDFSYPKNDYVLKDVFVDDGEEEDLLASIDEELSEERVSKHINMLLPKLSNVSTSILDLFSIRKLSEEEIALVKGIPVQEVRFYIEEAKKLIKISMESRF